MDRNKCCSSPLHFMSLAQIGEILADRAISVSKYKSLIKMHIDTIIARLDPYLVI